MNGKGSANRVRNFDAYRNSYENIEFRTKGTFCSYCGQNISKEILEKYKDGFIFYKDGSIEHKKCKFM